MNTVQRFFRKYFLSTIGVFALFVLIFFLTNIVIMAVIHSISERGSAIPDLSVSKLSNMVTKENGVIQAETGVADILSENNAWAMLLDDAGRVVWEEQMPSDLPRTYTALQVAQFSRWFLQDYPVFVWENPAGLFVLAYPPDSLQKYNFVMEARSVWAEAVTIPLAFLANALLTVFLFWLNTHKVEKAVKPILAGISIIGQGKSVILEECGELAEIKAGLNRASEQLHKKDTARADWISGISHDIRTPLSIILGYASEMEDNSSLPTYVHKQAGLIRSQGEKLRSLIIDLNLTSRLEYSMQPLNKTVISPVELARQVLSSFINNGLDGQYDMELTVKGNAEMVLIEGDEALLKRMFGNLVGNSVRHNPEGCGIVISVEAGGNACVITVRDTGLGVDKDVLTRLNTEVTDSITQNDNGEVMHGNGLKLVRQIAKAHRGTIAFSATEPHGLTATFRIPVKSRIQA